MYLLEPFSNGRSKHVYAIKRVQLSEGAWVLCSLQTWEDCLGWAMSSVGFTESAYCVSRCFHSLAIVKLCSDLSAIDSSPFLHQGVWWGNVCRKVSNSHEVTYSFIFLNCVCGSVYMWLQLLKSRRADQGPGAGVTGAVNSNVGAGNWARILWSNSKCSEPLSCLPSTKSLSFFYRFIQTLPYIKTNWGLQEGGKQCRSYSLRFEFSMLSVGPWCFPQGLLCHPGFGPAGSSRYYL